MKGHDSQIRVDKRSFKDTYLPLLIYFIMHHGTAPPYAYYIYHKTRIVFAYERSTIHIYTTALACVMCLDLRSFSAIIIKFVTVQSSSSSLGENLITYLLRTEFAQTKLIKNVHGYGFSPLQAGRARFFGHLLLPTFYKTSGAS